MSSYIDINETVISAYDEDFPLLMPRWGYVVSAFVLFLIGFFGFFLNLMVILLMFKDRQLWTPLNIILFNLVCSDFSVSVLGNPFTLISALFHRWVFGQTMCVLYGFFMALLGITSITTLTVISFERYMMVTRPLSSRHLTSKGAVLSIIFIWTYSLALTTPPLIGWGNYVNEAANISCSVNWHEQSMNTLTYIMFLFAMGQIVPLGVITFSYVNIIRTLKQINNVSDFDRLYKSMCFYTKWATFFKTLMQLKEIDLTEQCRLYVDITATIDVEDIKLPLQIEILGQLVTPKDRLNRKVKFSTIESIERLVVKVQNSQRLGRVSRAEARATAMVFIMIIAFTVAWTPYSLFALMEQFATAGIISPGAGVIPALVAKSSICYNPLIYVGMNTQFRQSIKRIFGIHSKTKQSRSEKGFNNTVMSPTHKMSDMNDATTRINSSDTIVSTTISRKISKDKKLLFADEISEIGHDNRTFQRDVELCTIQENRTASDAEKSIETTYEGENDHKIGIFGASCNFFRKHSPVVTIIDTEHLIFSKVAKKNRSDDDDATHEINGYGNEAYEDHLTERFNTGVYNTENEYQRIKSQKQVKRSFSLDLSVIANENKKRKLSIETKFETIVEPKGFFKDTIVGKFFEQDSNQFKSYLCNIDKNENTDEDI